VKGLPNISPLEEWQRTNPGAVPRSQAKEGRSRRGSSWSGATKRTTRFDNGASVFCTAARDFTSLQELGNFPCRRSISCAACSWWGAVSWTIAEFKSERQRANFGWQFLEQYRGPPREFVEQHCKCRSESPISQLMFSIAACRATSLATELRECFWDSRWGETDYVL
jgi:hypothetical protein